MWHFWELIHQEPPKLFPFTQWSLEWIRGDVDFSQKINFQKDQDDVYDRAGRLINVEGYLIDKSENIIDQYGRVVFSKDLLSYCRGQDARIPRVFTLGVFLEPEIDQDQQYTMSYEQESALPETIQVQPVLSDPPSVIESKTAAS